jgi:NAD+ diphosphatase
MIGFTADYKSGEIKIDPQEIEQAGFFDKAAVVEKLPRNSSIARKMIDEYLDINI